MLTKSEEAELIRLMGKMEFPMSRELFFAWAKSSVTISADVIVVRKTPIGHEVFLVYRDDEFYKGWHVPGSVRLPSETWNNTLERVLDKELGLPVSTKTEFFKWLDHPFGIGVGESPRGASMSIYTISMDPVGIVENDNAKFFHISSLPREIIPIHVPIMKYVVERFTS